MIEKILAYAVEKVLSYAKKQGCSDVHISTNALPMVRIDGDMIAIPGTSPLTESQVSEMIFSVMTENQKKLYQEKMELDFAIQVGDDLRFRVNAFCTINGPAASFREIPNVIKTLSDLHAPESVRILSKLTKGLVLVVGPTGSGKSTTLAALIDSINSNQQSHIITIEDPVEFVHKNKKSLVNQREVGSTTHSFADALKSALREDPDVILVGELRNVETIQLALTAAETGHLVLATLHTSSAAQTINRIIDVFPAEDKMVVRSMLSSSIKAVVSQILVKKEGGGRCAVFEVMLANPSIRNLIREDKIPQINSIMELGKKAGMSTMKDSINELLTRGFISKETADEALLANE
ncbi:MAG: type IV pilus twitching motility protein PilT [Proteobacteria bacterium]|nr:type IV pilus twitching motility protein PilT [Pseudomonadota bacterium]